VTRVVLLLVLLAALGFAQQEQKPAPPPPEQQHAEPEEEDVTEKPKEYTFNPIQAANEMKVGRFYMHRGKPKAAAGRFEEATKWNPQLVEAWQALGDAREKLRDFKGAREAYEACLKLGPDKDVSKRLSKLPKK